MRWHFSFSFPCLQRKPHEEFMMLMLMMLKINCITNDASHVNYTEEKVSLRHLRFLNRFKLVSQIRCVDQEAACLKVTSV